MFNTDKGVQKTKEKTNTQLGTTGVKVQTEKKKTKKKTFTKIKGPLY